MNYRFRALLKFVVCTVLLTGQTLAATYYVDDQGSNANPGSKTQPWKTIQYGVNQLIAGDTLLVEDGSYQGFLVTTSGTQNSRIIIKANSNGAYIVSDSRIGDDPEERITINNASYITIEGFIIPGDNSRGNGIGTHGANASHPMKGLIIRNNTVHDVGSSTSPGNTGIYASHSDGIIIEGNIIYNAGEHGIYISNAGSKNAIVRENTIYNNGFEGIHINGDTSSGGDGRLTGISMSKNHIHSNAVSGISMDGVQNSTISNNLIHNNGRHGIAGYQIDGAVGPDRLIIVNNTFYGNNSWAIRLSTDNGNHTIFNNILHARNGSIRTDIGNDASNYRSDYNIGTGKFSINGGNSILTLQQWQSLTLQDNLSATHSAKELFVSPSTYNFSLKANSPAIDSGTNKLNEKDAPKDDIISTSRLQGQRHDIGAYEYYNNFISSPTGLMLELLN